MRRSHPGNDSLPGLRHTLLHVPRHAQIRGHSYRDQGTGNAQGTDRDGRSRRTHEQPHVIGPEPYRLNAACVSNVLVRNVFK